MKRRRVKIAGVGPVTPAGVSPGFPKPVWPLSRRGRRRPIAPRPASIDSRGHSGNNGGLVFAR